jgi:hypothetical protein
MMRHWIAAALLPAMLGACATQEQVVAGAQAEAVRITDVTVEAAPAASADPRGFDLSEGELEARLRAPVLDALDDLNPGGSRDATLALTVSRVFVANPGTAVVGRSGSVAEGSAQLLDARTGAPIGAPFPVRGGTGTRAGGLLGAAITAGTLADGGQEAEVGRIGQGLGQTLARAIYGTDPA